MSFNRKKLILFFIVVLLLNISSINNHIGIGEDDAKYIILSRSLIRGSGYRNIYLKSQPISVTHPPLFSFMLAILSLIFGERIVIFRVFCLICFLTSVFILLKDYKQTNNKNYLFAILLFLFSPLSLFLSTEIIAESLFLNFVFLFLLYLPRYTESPTVINKYFFLVFLSIVMAFYSRLVGIVLVFSGSTFLFIKRKKKKAILLCLFSLVFILPWLYFAIYHKLGLYNYIFRVDLSDNGFSLLNITEFLIRTVKNFIIYFGKVVADAIFYPHLYNITKKSYLFLVKFIISSIFSILIFIGFFKNIRKGPFIFYLFFYCLILAIWPLNEPRFLWPVFVFFIFCIYEGIDVIFRLKSEKIKYILFIIIIFSSLIGNLQLIFKRHLAPYSPEERSFLEALRWIRENTPKESIILSRKPIATFYHTNRFSDYYPNTLDKNRALSLIKNKGADYVILDLIGYNDREFGLWNSGRFLKPLIEEYPEKFYLIFKTAPPETKVYKFID